MNGGNGIKLWNSDSNELVHEFDHGSKVNAVACSAKGRTIVSGGVDGIVRVWKAFLELNRNQEITHKNGSKKRIDPLKVHLIMATLAEAIHKKKKEVKLGLEMCAYYEFLNEHEFEGSIGEKIVVEEEDGEKIEVEEAEEMDKAHLKHKCCVLF